MCQQVQSVTLQNAVLLQVTAFAQLNQMFSVHDITAALRHQTAQGELEIPECETQGASFRYKILHDNVKEIFDELRNTNAFDPAVSMTRQFNGMYFEYTPTYTASVTPAPTPDTTPAPIATPAPSVTPTPVAPVATPNVTTDITSRVALYLTNCANRNFRPNLKQVQSAIKRGDFSTGTSCDELKTIVEGLGYTVVTNPDSLSSAQVATV